MSAKNTFTHAVGLVAFSIAAAQAALPQNVVAREYKLPTPKGPTACLVDDAAVKALMIIQKTGNGILVPQVGGGEWNLSPKATYPEAFLAYSNSTDVAAAKTDGPSPLGRTWRGIKHFFGGHKSDACL